MKPLVHYYRGRRIDDLEREELVEACKEGWGAYGREIGRQGGHKPDGRADPVVVILLAVVFLSVLIGMIWTFYLRTV